MPDFRLTPKREGFSDKINALDHLAYRVWQQYKLSADDYGVMPDSVSAIKAGNRCLDEEPDKAIRRSLDVMLASGLLHRFTHQGQRYLYSRVWQDHQKVRYPSETLHPIPTDEEFRQCSYVTCELFIKNHANVSEVLRKWFESLPSPPVRARTRNAIANADANAGGEHERGGADDVEARRYLKEFQALYRQHRNGAAYFVKWKEHPPIVVGLLRVHAFDRLLQHAQVLLTTDEEWISTTDRGIEILAKKINWLEARVADWEARRGVA